MAFTEFYCDPSVGSNLNSGSTTASAATYTSAGGNWDSTNNIFTPTDGSNPSLNVSVGDFASIYVTAGATQTGYVARVTAVQNATNGTITVSAATNVAGSKPSTGTGTLTLKVGGAWKGPNGSQNQPFNLATLYRLRNINGDQVRINLKNNAIYSLAINVNTIGNCVIQGYSSSPGDGGLAVIDFGTSISTWTVGSGDWCIDVEFKSSATSGSSDLVVGNSGASFLRCIFHGSRGNGLALSGSANARECEAYGNNLSNTFRKAGFLVNSGNASWFYCYSHDNVGSNNCGFYHGGSGSGSYFNCISDSNQLGFLLDDSASSTTITIDNCDIYNSASDGIKCIQTLVTATQDILIQNCNFIKNGGKAINNTENSSGAGVTGFCFNAGYGAGTQANGSADTLGHIVMVNKITYANDVTPYNAPTTGDFRINLAAAINAGRGAFIETDGTNTGTIGYPDIGAAQALSLDAVTATITEGLPDGFINHAYAWTGDSGVGNDFVASIQSGSLPTGLSLSQPTTHSWQIVGTPTTVGGFSFVFRIRRGSSYGDANCSITIQNDPDSGIGVVGGG
jgi:hypothetical protein